MTASFKRETIESTVKAIYFDGEEQNWREWKAQVLSYAAKKLFTRALTTKLELIGEDIYYQESTTDAQRKDYDANAEAYSFLMLSIKPKTAAFGIVELARAKEQNVGDAHGAWKQLIKRYEDDQVEISFTQATNSFYACKLKSIEDDPVVYFQDLEYWNGRLATFKRASGTGTYEKDELELKVHVLDNLPNGYNTVKAILKMDENASYKRVKDAIIGYHNEYKKNDTTERKDYALAFYQFKGRCNKCGEIGHKAKFCRSTTTEVENNKKGGEGHNEEMKNTTMKHITCYHCEKKGHIASKCPEKYDEAFSGMFTGVAISTNEED